MTSDAHAYSLVKNWHKEIEKWVGNDADIGVIAITGGLVLEDLVSKT